MLITAAAHVFVRDGYDAPLRTVLAEAGLGRGTLYRHFTDRSSLILAVLEHEHCKLTAFVEAHIHAPTLLIEFVRRQGRLSTLILPFLRKLDRDEVLRLVAPLSLKADALNERVAAIARESGVVEEGFTGSDLRLVNRMLMQIGENDAEADDAALFDRALQFVLTGIAKRSTDP